MIFYLWKVWYSLRVNGLFRSEKAGLVRVIEIQQNLAATLGVFDGFFDLGGFVGGGKGQI